VPRPRAEPPGSISEHRENSAYEEKKCPCSGAEVRDHKLTPAGDGEGISEAAGRRAACCHDEASACANRVNERQEMEKRGSREGHHDLLFA
jgi:hypothetical protein